VAVAITAHPAHGPSLVLSERPAINGHDGGRMSNPGQVVLFGGGAEPSETPEQTATRELVEEAGLADASSIRAVETVGTWTTELGIVVTGVLLVLPDDFARTVAPDPREVARIDYLPLSCVYDGPWQVAAHLVAAADRWPPVDQDVLIESPTLVGRVSDNDEDWTLWGVAGHMVSQLRQRHSLGELEGLLAR